MTDTLERTVIVAMPERYANCRNYDDAQRAYQEIEAEAQAAWPNLDDELPLWAVDANGVSYGCLYEYDLDPGGRAGRWNRYGEFMRALDAIRDRPASQANPRRAVEPNWADEDRTMIVCAGPCGETKSIRKFPTRSHQPGVREPVCRACRDAR